MAKAVEALPRPWGRGESRVGVVKAVGAWPRPWGRGQGRGGVAKAVGAWSRPWGRFQGRGGVACHEKIGPGPKLVRADHLWYAIIGPSGRKLDRLSISARNET